MAKAVIFDVGGVLAHDVWEHLLLDPMGIAEEFNISRDQVETVGSILWEAFAYREAKQPTDHDKLEREYWNAFIKGFRLSKTTTIEHLLERTDAFIVPIRGMINLLEKLKMSKVDLLICSNNNEFWFERQKKKLKLDVFIANEDKIVLSCRVGVPKSHPSGKMFKDVITALDSDCKPKDCVFVDDRDGNIRRALEHGMTGILFPSHAEYGAKYLERILQDMGYIN